MATADGLVLPNPGIPKTIGTLNVVFGSILILLGTCAVGFFLGGPFLISLVEGLVKQEKAKDDANHQAAIKKLEDREKEAATEPEKVALKQQRDDLVAKPPKALPVNVDSARESLENPTIRTTSLIQAGTGIVMDVLLIVSGIGLMRFRPWGRTLALRLAGIQLVRLAILTAVSIIYVVPVSVEIQRRQIAKMEKQIQGLNPPADVMAALQMTKAMIGTAPVFSGGYLVVGSIYPIISLILLTRPSARAACRPSKPEGPEQY